MKVVCFVLKTDIHVDYADNDKADGIRKDKFIKGKLPKISMNPKYNYIRYSDNSHIEKREYGFYLAE